MIKMIVRLIFLGIVASLIFIGLAIHSGGEKFRWFGKKVEQESEKMGEKADKIKRGSYKVIKDLEKTTEKVKEFTGIKKSKSDEKAH